MVKLSKAIPLAVAILCIIFAVTGATPDFSDYYDGTITCADRNSMKLGFAISDEFKNLMEVNSFKRKTQTKMYVRIAPKSDSDEVNDAISDYEETKKKIEENDSDTISFKENQGERRLIGIPDFGFGTLKKGGKPSVPCYYFVVEYSDDYSDYLGGTIVGRDGNSMKLDDAKPHRENHAFKVKSFNGKKVFDMYARFAPLSDFIAVVSTIGDWESTKQEIENPNANSYNKTRRDEQPFDIPSEGNGILKKDGKRDVPCYYFVVDYNSHDHNKKYTKK